MRTPTFHARSLSAPSLQPAIQFAKRCRRWFTGWDFSNATYMTSPASVISELRTCGFVFDKDKREINGKKVTVWKTLEVPK